jgi:ADP-heptose:LPS heptosyltransferase
MSSSSAVWKSGKGEAAEVAQGTQLKGKYLVQRPALYALLSTVDWVLDRLPKGKATPLAKAPKRVLIAMGGHIGDAVIGSSVIPLVRAAWPEAEIGVLAASWSKLVLHGHPDVARVHLVDHWKLNRDEKSGRRKFTRYLATRRVALKEIRAVEYDLAIDLYPYFPNSIALLARAGIPVRVGYTSGGFGALLTHPQIWRDTPRHTAEYLRDLVRAVEPAAGGLSRLRYSLAPPALPSGESVWQPPGADGYVIMHIGAGLALREWPLERWKLVVDSLLADGHTLVFTGKGERQAQDAQTLTENKPRCHNLCDRIGWNEFVAVVANAQLAVTVESVAGHLAAGVGTPAVVLMSGMTRLEQWSPLGDQVRTVSNPVPCAPCFRSAGCEGMMCVRGISVEEVVEAVRSQLAASGNPTPTLSPASQPAW